MESVVSQDYDDLEFIVLDAGSTDGSRDIIEEYRSRISQIIFEPDDGPADGLNKGFALATGEVYGFLNSDDILLTSALHDVGAFFAQNPNVDVISGHSLVIDKTGAVLRRAFSDHFNLIFCAYDSNVLMQQSTFFRASAFKRTTGFNNLNRIAWDGELFVDLAQRGAKFATVDKFWSSFRLHTLSITSSARLDNLRADYRKHIFRKIIGRESRAIDVVIALAFRITKHLRSPRALLERLVAGPIYRRKL